MVGCHEEGLATIDRLLKHPLLVLVCMLVLGLAAGIRASRVRQNNSPETFFAADERARAIYADMVATFGGDEHVLIELRGADLARPTHLRSLARLADRARQLPGIVRVLSPVDALQGLDPSVAVDAQQLARIRAEVEAVPLYRKSAVYRPDIPSLGVLAIIVMRGPEARQRLAAALRAIEIDFSANGLTAVAAGLAPANAAIDRETRRSLGLYLPIVGALIVIIGTVLFRSIFAVVAILLPVGIAVSIGVAALHLTGEQINIVTGVMPPLVLAVGFAGGVHLVSHYASLLGRGDIDTATAVRLTVRSKLLPTVFAYGTTAAGFGSLALSPVASVRVLGLCSALALVAALGLVLVGTPALLLLLRPRPAPPRRHLLANVAQRALDHRTTVLVGAAALGVLALIGVTRVRTSIDGVDLLAPDAPERIAFQRLEREGVGLGNIDVWLHLPVPDERALIQSARKLQRLAGRLSSIPQVTSTGGVHDLLVLSGYRLSGAARIPDSLAAMKILLEPERLREVQRALRLYYHPERGLKLTLMVTTPEQKAFSALERRIRHECQAVFPGVRTDISGHFAMLLGTPGALTQTLSRSLAATVGVVALLLALYFRNLRLWVAAMVTNLLPVLIAVGAMGWAGVPFDVATIMTASLAFGIAVDDTFHYLYHYRQSGSIMKAACITGQGIVSTTIVIAGGFAALAVSGFRPVFRFGLLTSVVVLLALVAAAVLLPAITSHSRVGCGTQGGRR